MGVTTLVDIVLGVFAAEAFWLLAWSVTRRKKQVVRLVPTLLSGICLVVALRVVAHQGAWPTVALWLLAAGCAHAADLALRLRR